MIALLQDKTRLLPPPNYAAFLLDFDETLVNIALTPSSGRKSSRNPTKFTGCF